MLGLVFIPILHGNLSGGLALARGPDILTSIKTCFCYGFKQCIGAKMSGPPAGTSPDCCVYMEDFQPSQARSRAVNGEISPKRASPLSISTQKVFIRGMTRVVRSRLHINTL